MVARNRDGIGLSYRPARLPRLAELIPWNWFLGSLKVIYSGPGPNFLAVCAQARARSKCSSCSTRTRRRRTWASSPTTKWASWTEFAPSSSSRRRGSCAQPAWGSHSSSSNNSRWGCSNRGWCRSNSSSPCCSRAWCSRWIYFFAIRCACKNSSVADPDPPDPHVFGPSGSTSQRYGSGSGSFYHDAQIVRKTLSPTILWLLLTFYLWKIM